MTFEAADREELIRVRAYYLWEDAGRPADRADEFWFQALSMLDAETVAVRRNAREARWTARDLLQNCSRSPLLQSVGVWIRAHIRLRRPSRWIEALS